MKWYHFIMDCLKTGPCGFWEEEKKRLKALQEQMVFWHGERTRALKDARTFWEAGDHEGYSMARHRLIIAENRYNKELHK